MKSSVLSKELKMENTYEEIRGVTGWVRPPGTHGCKPVQIVPGLWTAHYHDIDTKEKLTKTGLCKSCALGCRVSYLQCP